MTGPRVGLLGGTFDPIHDGHLATARAAAAAIGFDRLLFIPARQPPHRRETPAASGYHRLQMTALAVAGTAGWEASDVELLREGPSYTIETLTWLRRHHADWQFFFITGADAFAEIATWHRYPEVLDLAHFVVVARTGTSLADLRARLPALAPRMVPADRLAATCGHALEPPAIVLIEAVTPDISATEIRTRAGRGESLAGLVPAAVADYIRSHHLYA